MPKTKISEYSATANSNTDVASINIDEGCAPSGINNAIRAIMGHLKDFQSGTSNDPFTVGSSGSLTLSYGTANGVAYLNGSKVLTTGSALVFDGSNLGLGVTPSANSLAGSGYRNLEIGSVNGYGLFAGSYEIYLLGNAYYNSGWKYANSSKLASRYIQTDGIHAWFNAPSGTAGNTITFTQAMTLDAGGRLLLNRTTNNNNEALQVSGNANSLCSAFFANTTTGQSYGAYIAAGTNSTDYAFRIQNAAANTDYLKVTGDGNLLVGQTTQSGTSNGISFTPAGAGTNSPAAYIAGAGTVSTAAGIAFYNTTASAYRFYVTYAGNINATNTTITAISDQRLKENIRDLDDGLEKVMALQPRKFDWKEGKGQDIKNARGFIAQEFETVFPDMIQEWLDTPPEGEEPYKAINANLIPTLVKAIQEQQALITQLTARITALEGA